MLNKILRLLFGSKHERDIAELNKVVAKVNLYSDQFSKISDKELQNKTAYFKQELANGKTLDDILPEAFAVVREAAWRILGERPFDTQVMGGIVLHQGKIAEMKTGEGKTLTSTMPVYLNALAGKGVHVVTVNDYLAKRDSEWMGQIYEFLGLSVGVIQSNMPYEYKKVAYECDVTYGTNNEFGFDYLRDNMVENKMYKMQRGHPYCIVDEVDSVLIDEARTPLIISGPSEESTDKYYKINRIIPFLKKEVDFIIDEKAHTVTLTEEGNKNVERLLEIDNLYSNQNVGLVHHINQGLRAHHLYQRDVDYIVKDGEVIIVDEFTGRLMPGRRFSEGLHQALEAKEGVNIANENQTLATITFQNYFKLYTKLSGMTGTADTEAAEFHEIYKLDVVVIPTNKPLARIDEPDKIYKTQKEKMNAIADEIVKIHSTGQPILVGTISIEKSEEISKHLHRKNIQHNVLNAKHHEKEASIIKQAGRPGMVTIATNMAGRGTDIVLGGYPEFKSEFVYHTENSKEDFTNFLQLIIQNQLKESEALLPKFSEEEKEEAYMFLVKRSIQNFDFESAKNYMEHLTLHSSKKKLQKIYDQAQEWKNNHDLVINRGGLYIIGTERHESRRIDNQLRGRAGRQGDPGHSCFYIALDDELMRLFGSERIASIMGRLGMGEGEAIQHPWIAKSIENAQKKVEGRNFDIRKHLLEYDNVINDQRNFIYTKRDQILEGEDIKNDVADAIYDTLEMLLEKYVDTKKNVWSWDIAPFFKYIQDTYSLNLNEKIKISQFSKKEAFIEEVYKYVKEIYDKKESQIGSDKMRELERFIFLQVMDNHWKDHLYAMDTLKEGIGLRGYAQKDPLIEYKFEAFNYFKLMLENVKKEVVEFIIKMDFVVSQDEYSSNLFKPSKINHQDFNFFGMAEQEAQQKRMEQQQSAQNNERHQIIVEHKVGRNDPCPCGSGKKYKHCHGKNK